MLDGNLPEIDTFLEVYNVGEEPQAPILPRGTTDQAALAQHNKDKKAYEAALRQYKGRCQFLLWYVDSWLPMVANCFLDMWGPMVRPYYYPSSKVKLPNMTQERVLVTQAGEAFGLLQYQNSRTRWLAVFEWKKNNPATKGKKPQVPTYNKNNPDTKDFMSKWSDFAHGQGSGWDPACYAVFNKRMNWVQEFRIKDKEEGYPVQKLAQKLVREDYGIDLDVTGPPSRKRKIQVVEEYDEEDSDATEMEELMFIDE